MATKYSKMSDDEFLKEGDRLWELATKEKPFDFDNTQDDARYWQLVKKRSAVCNYRDGKWVFRNRAAHVFDKEMLMKDGVKSMADGHTYTTRSAYNDHLKRHDMVEVGDQASAKPHEMNRGDHNVSRELKAALEQHLR